MVKVSIIITTYNRAQFIQRIYKQVVAQDYSNFELLIINDGSTDETSEILSSFDDIRLKIFDVPNGGVSNARNIGLSNASGEYIFFIDDDDIIPSDYISNFLKPNLKSYDLVIDSYSRTSDFKKYEKINFSQICLNGSQEIIGHLCNMMPENPYCFFVHAKRFKGDLIKKYQLRFNHNLTLGEDRVFIMDYIQVAGSAIIVNDAKYVIVNDLSSGYRLSDNKKPLGLLWKNFRLTYEYLKKYEKSTSLVIGEYIDNYITTRIYDYILIPYLMQSTKSSSDKIIYKEVIALWKKNVNPRNIRRADVKRFGLMLRYVGYRFAITVLSSKINLLNFIRRNRSI